MVFCNGATEKQEFEIEEVTILILIDGFLQYYELDIKMHYSEKVTILILIDGFLQFNYFNGCSTDKLVTILILIDGFLQYV